MAAHRKFSAAPFTCPKLWSIIRVAPMLRADVHSSSATSSILLAMPSLQSTARAMEQRPWVRHRQSSLNDAHLGHAKTLREKEEMDHEPSAPPIRRAWPRHSR